jgi:sugar diacid utilization regulator
VTDISTRIASVSLGELIASPALTPLLRYLSTPPADVTVEGVALVERLEDLDEVLEHRIVLFSRDAREEVGRRRFDAVLRGAGGRRVAALVLGARDSARLSAGTTTLAQELGMAILGAEDGADLAELAAAIGVELAGGASSVLMRAHTALEAIAADSCEGTIDSLLERAGAAFGLPLSMVQARPRAPQSRPIVVDDRIEGWLTMPARTGDLGLGVEIVLEAAVVGVADLLKREAHARENPSPRRDLLTDVLVASASHREEVALRARSVGLPIDAWHIVVRLDFESLSDAPPPDESIAYEARMRLGASALAAVRVAGGTWHDARSEGTIVMVRSYRGDTGVQAAGDVARLMQEVLCSLRGTMPTTIVRCGVGCPSAGASGLLTSLAESKAAALAARTRHRDEVAVAFDNLGLRRSLIDWYASDIAREAARSILAPLTAVGGVRAERLIQTLHVYLDERNSLTRTAQRLNLHRNAVAYRVNQAFELLDVDQDDPDDLLLLQLACRARELT